MCDVVLGGVNPTEPQALGGSEFIVTICDALLLVTQSVQLLYASSVLPLSLSPSLLPLSLSLSPPSPLPL